MQIWYAVMLVMLAVVVTSNSASLQLCYVDSLYEPGLMLMQIGEDC